MEERRKKKFPNKSDVHKIGKRVAREGERREERESERVRVRTRREWEREDRDGEGE